MMINFNLQFTQPEPNFKTISLLTRRDIRLRTDICLAMDNFHKENGITATDLRRFCAQSQASIMDFDTKILATFLLVRSCMNYPYAWRQFYYAITPHPRDEAAIQSVLEAGNMRSGSPEELALAQKVLDPSGHFLKAIDKQFGTTNGVFPDHTAEEIADFIKSEQLIAKIVGHFISYSIPIQSLIEAIAELKTNSTDPELLTYTTHTKAKAVRAFIKQLTPYLESLFADNVIPRCSECGYELRNEYGQRLSHDSGCSRRNSPGPVFAYPKEVL